MKHLVNSYTYNLKNWNTFQTLYIYEKLLK
jgi:hypothetical protein